MGSPKANTLEGGSNGTTVSTGNSGGTSGDAFNAVTLSGSTTCTYTTSTPIRGALSLRLAYASSQAGYVVWNFSPTSTTTRTCWHFYIYIPAGETFTTQDLFIVRSASAAVMTIGLNSSGQIVVKNSAGTTVATASAALSTGVKYRIEVGVAVGTTSSNGKIDVSYYLGHSTSAVQAIISSTAQNTGTAAATLGRFGTAATVASARVIEYDDMAVQELASGFIGPSVTAITPKTLASNWAVRAQITKTLASTWHVRSSITPKTLSTVWGVRTAVTPKTLSTGWAVRAAIAKTLASSWAVRGFVTKTLSTVWSVRALVSVTLATSWAVRTSTVKTLASGWGLRAAVDVTLETAWGVRALVTKTLASLWQVRALVTVELASGWSVRCGVVLEVETSWEVLTDAGPVVRTLSTRWAVRAPVVRELETTWAVRTPVVKTLSTGWAVRAAVLLTLLVTWMVRASVFPLHRTLAGSVADPLSVDGTKRTLTAAAISSGLSGEHRRTLVGRIVHRLEGSDS